MGQDKVFQNIRWGLIMVAMATVTAEDPLFTCDFETDDLCGMEQWDHDYFDWIRHSGRTPSGMDSLHGPTGPRGAHVGTYYIYIETSSPRRQYERAYISTPAIRHSGDICVRFYYNMYGRHIGHLTVFSEQQGENNPVWREEGNKGEAWLDGNVTVKDFTENDKVVFLGQAGLGHLGDIAIDYVRIHPGECACQENNGGCDTFCVILAEPPYSECQCHDGYHIESDPQICVDIDECLSGNDGCSHQCLNTVGTYQCRCEAGYLPAADKRACTDIDECLSGNDGCSHQCLNMVGTYQCRCEAGYLLAADKRACTDIDECATDADNECDHLCVNVEGSYNCSCRDTYIRATDGRHCIECASVYKKTVETSQIFTSDCPTTSSHTGITLADCLLEACRAQTEVVSYLNRVCHLKLCEEGDLRLQISPGNNGWDIYELDTTWPEANREDDQANTGDHLPLVPVVVGVLAPVVLLVAIVIAVVLLRRRRRTREGSESVHYENDPGHNITDREHDKTPPTTTEVHSAAGIYDEVADPDNKQQVPRNETYDDVTGDPVARNPQVKEAAPTDASEGNTYKNAAFQGDCRYQGLGPDGNPRHYDTIE